MSNDATGLNPKPLVLVVDDEPRDRELLKEVLEAEEYRVAECSDGLEALKRVSEIHPDVILLDVMIPGLDGVQVCRRLNEDPRTVAIPVLLVTSQQTREARLEGISAGARDFISKPVDIQDLKIRVRNAAQMKRLLDEGEEKYQKILSLEELRDGIVHMVVHDLRSPLTLIQGNLSLLEMILGDDIGEDGLEALESCTKGAAQMKQMISSLLDLNKLESGNLEPDYHRVEMGETARSARASLGKTVGNRILLADAKAEGEAFVVCDPDLVERVIVNMLWNGLEYGPINEPVKVRVLGADTVVRVEVEDRGPEVAEEFREKVFEKYVRRDGGSIRGGAAGLGLAFSKLVVEAHRGRIGVERNPGGGSVFWFELPKDRTPL